MKQAIFLSTAILLFVTTAGYSQETAHQHPRFGIKAGPSYSNLKVENAGNVNDKQPVPTWHVGMYVDYPLIPAFSLQAGLQFGMKGAQYTIGDKSSSNYAEVSTRPIYLELPLNAVAKFAVANNWKVIVGGGPYIATAIGGKNKVEGKLLGVTYSDDRSIQYGNDNNNDLYNTDLKRFDAGLNFLGGVEIGHFTLNLNYGHGLSNIKSNSDNGNVKFSNRGVSLSFGILF